MKQRFLRYILIAEKTKDCKTARLHDKRQIYINTFYMKTFYSLAITLLTFLLLSGCMGRGTSKKELLTAVDTVSVPDTGYTGIKKYMNKEILVKEVTFKNGVREGLMKSFYQDGRMRQSFWYENGLREDSAKWYYEDGQVFRATPYKHDTVDGIQQQYYKNGRIKARLGYKKGLRTPFLEEFGPDGKLLGGYPELVVNIQDDYKAKGIYRITLSLSSKSEKVRYYTGDLSLGVFDTAHCELIKTIKGIGNLNLKKTKSTNSGYIGIIAEILTNFGNNNLVYKKIELPYSDLN
jgi:antitoxin component YwqK of YwqJK toxin-antitoxin module